MNYLLDTNVVSEWAKQRPDPGVVAWLTETDEDRIFISVITLTELRHGIERLPAGARRDWLDSWLSNDLPSRFEARILPIDEETANYWGKTMARRPAAGRPVGTMDAFVATIAERQDLTLVTRNVYDFEALNLQLINTWENG